MARPKARARSPEGRQYLDLNPSTSSPTFEEDVRAEVQLLEQKIADMWRDANSAHASRPIERNRLALRAATAHRDDMREVARLSQTAASQVVVVRRLAALTEHAIDLTDELHDSVIDSGDYFTRMYEVDVHDMAAKQYAGAVYAIHPTGTSEKWRPPISKQVEARLAMSRALGRRFPPSLADVEAVAQRLCEGFPTRSGGAIALSPELARAVLLRADYARPVVTQRRDLVQGCNLDTRYLTTDAVTPDALVAKQGQEFGRLCRVEVICLSHDQGWASYADNGFTRWASGVGSWTWGTLLVVDAADDSVVLHEEEAYRNERASYNWQFHERTWNEESELVRRLKTKGGRVVLRLRSTKPNWVNNVVGAAVTLFYL